jgi:multiple antibiotic resistance protein
MAGAPACSTAVVSLFEYTLFTFTSMFVIVDPLATVPAFLAMTPHNTHAQQDRMALIACAVAAGVLMVFALAGPLIFKFLGITLPAFQIAGSVLLMRIALDMLYAQRTRERQTDEEVRAGAQMEDVAITPLGVPMLAGPGAISTALILLNQADDFPKRVALFVSIAGVCFWSYVILRVGARGARLLNPLALKLVTRLMGLLLAAIAVQFAINGISELPMFAK